MKNSRIRYARLEEKCVELAAEMGMTDRVLYSSFNHHSLLYLKQLDPSLPCGALYDATLVRPGDYAHGLGLNAIHPHFSELQIDGECAHAHALGLEVNPWTVNEEQDVRDAIRAGADRIITNYPDRALAILKELAE